MVTLQMKQTGDPAELRELADAVSEQSGLVEDFLRDSEERFAELTRRIAELEDRTRRPSDLLFQASSRDTTAANSVNELRSRQNEVASGLAGLRNELNKWEAEMNDRFLVIERSRIGSAPEGRLSEVERKVHALDTGIDGIEKLITELSGRLDAVYARTAPLDRLPSDFSFGDVPRRLQALELRAASLEISIKTISQKIILLGPHVIE